jgi:hypothetical protein
VTLAVSLSVSLEIDKLLAWKWLRHGAKDSSATHSSLQAGDELAELAPSGGALYKMNRFAI